MAEARQFVTFGVAGDMFATPVETIREILDLRTVSRLPKAPKELLGIIDVRGQGVPVIDLRALLGLSETEDTTHTRIVVMNTQRGTGELAIGLKTDRVFEVTHLDTDDLEPPPEIGGDWSEGAVKGVGRRQGAFVSVLDVGRLIANIDFRAAAAAA
jgi:purine-binding chemotaxis protein CheW